MPHEDPVLRAVCEGRPPWEQVVLIAERQGRMIQVSQLRACGLTRRTIEVATEKRHLHIVHRGVRAVGTRTLSVTGRSWAAHLAVGRDSVLSDLTGAACFGIRPWTGVIHLAAPTNRRVRQGVVVHHVVSLSAAMVTSLRGLPVMKPAHLLLDLTATAAATNRRWRSG